MSKYNISFIIPAYNCGKTLEDSVSSIFQDNYIHGDEVVIVNDCSDDNTSQIIRKIKRKYPFIRSISHKINLGGGAARNTAVKNSKNSLIFCLDSDNILERNCIASLRMASNKYPKDTISFKELKYFNNHILNYSHSWKFKYQVYDMHNYLSTNIVPGASGNYLFTKESWLRAGGYPEQSSALDTWGFGLRQVMSGTRIRTLPHTYYFHRIGLESYWVRESRRKNLCKLASDLLLPYANNLSIYDYLRIYIKPNSNWFNNLDAKPIRLKSNNKLNTAIIHQLNKLVIKLL